jgi:hypothetical protein
VRSANRRMTHEETFVPQLQTTRLEGQACANAEDASLWRWFAMLMEDPRIRWRNANDVWLVSVDHRHLSTERDFDGAIRAAMTVWDANLGRDVTRRLSANVRRRN